jgi:hypothetical protein
VPSIFLATTCFHDLLREKPVHVVGVELYLHCFHNDLANASEFFGQARHWGPAAGCDCPNLHQNLTLEVQVLEPVKERNLNVI